MNNFTSKKISFLNDLDKDIYIDKSWKFNYYKIYQIDLDRITNFIYNLKDNEVYVINPIISITCQEKHPYVNLSDKFLITNQSNPILINDFLLDQLKLFRTQFEFEDDFYFLILRYKLILINYKPLKGFIVNCPLEDYINLHYIFILGVLFFLIIRKLMILNIQKIIILLLWFLVIIYIQFGLLVLTQIIILFIIMILSNSLLGINPYDKGLHILKNISIILIIFILYYNSRDVLVSSAFMAPLSISRISYINDLDVPAFTDFESEKIEIFSKFTIKETTDFLNKLEDNENYIAEIGFIPCFTLWDLDAPQMSLSNPILINRNSSSTTINKFILERLNYMVDYYYLDDAIIQKESDCAVSLSYCKLKSI